MECRATSVKIIDLKNRWASYSPGGSVNFHWKCMMAPATVLDYIIVQELAHLIREPHRRVLERGRQRYLIIKGAKSGCASAGRGWDCRDIIQVHQCAYHVPARDGPAHPLRLSAGPGGTS
jgi:hypothetical protein